MARQLGERFGISACFSDLKEMLQATRPDVVHITTPPQSHYSLAKQCLECGCHVYVEKPFTLCTSEAEELLALANQKDLKLTVGHDEQFSHVARQMRRLIQSGYLGGPPIHIESTWCYELGESSYVNAVFGSKEHWVRQLPGGLLQNLISHGVAKIAEFLSTDAPRVIAVGFESSFLRDFTNNAMVDELRVVVAEEERITAYFTFSTQMRPLLHQLRIYGPTAGLLLDEDQQTLIKLRGQRYKSYLEMFAGPLVLAGQYLKSSVQNVKSFMSMTFHMDSGKKYLMESFYRSITHNTPVPIPHAQILLTSRIMDEIFERVGAWTNCSERSLIGPSGVADAGAVHAKSDKSSTVHGRA